MERFGEGQSVLVVDDLPEIRDLFRRTLQAAGLDVRVAQSVPEALAELERRRADIVVTDLRLPGASGIDLVRHVRENCADTDVLVLTGYPSVETAVESLKSGAEDYLAKPVSPAQLAAAVRRICERQQARRQLGRATGDEPRHGIVGTSDIVRTALRTIEREARGRAPVLFVGEPGTGRQALARVLHGIGRPQEPFIVADLVAMRAERIASELFGIEGGTGGPHTGLFQLAGAGTLFISGVALLPRDAQQVLLGALERPGPRIVSSATIDPATLAGRGQFDETLAVRLGAVRVTLPPLRERPEDILPIAQRFLDDSARAWGVPAPAVTDRALDAIRSYTWPGNADELRSVCRLLAARGSSIDLPDLPPLVRQAPARATAVHRSLAEIEGEHIRDVLEACEGNRTRAAEILGIDRKTLREKLRREAE